MPEKSNSDLVKSVSIFPEIPLTLYLYKKIGHWNGLGYGVGWMNSKKGEDVK